MPKNNLSEQAASASCVFCVTENVVQNYCTVSFCATHLQSPLMLLHGEGRRNGSSRLSFRSPVMHQDRKRPVESALPSVLLTTLLVGWHEGHVACKKPVPLILKVRW